MADRTTDTAATETVPAAAQRVAALFADAGFELYLVGGAVRDQMLGLGSAGDDIDLTTNARPPEILSIVEPLASAVWRQGEKFGTIGATVFERALEITTYRSESYEGDSRKPVVGFGDDLETDLGRRDFTINAMARDALTGELRDPFGGAQDLRAGVLRTPLDPEVSFTDDPLRMLRAARFATRLDLTFDPSLDAAAREFADRMSIVSGERIFAEIERILELPDPGRGLRFLWDTGVLRSSLDRAPLPPVKVVSDALDRFVSSPADDPAIRWAALCELTGVDVDDLSDLLKLSTDRLRDLRMLVQTKVPDADDRPAMRRLILSIGTEATLRAVEVQRLIGGLDAGEAAAFTTSFVSLSQAEPAERLRSPLSGSEVMALLQLDPGPLVGVVQRGLEDRAIAGGPLGFDEARAVAQEIAATSPGGSEKPE